MRNRLASLTPWHFMITMCLMLGFVQIANATTINPNMITYDRYNADQASREQNILRYPNPRPEHTQHVLTLAKNAEEATLKIEIQIGRTQAVDCNKHSLMGTVNNETLKGWGFQYYVVENVQQGPSTMMACFDKATTNKFLFLPRSLFVPYNSQLPIVIYTPSDIQIRYRLWTTTAEFQHSE